MDEVLRYLAQSQPPAYLLSERAPDRNLSRVMLLEGAERFPPAVATRMGLSLPEQDTSKYGLWAGMRALANSIEVGASQATRNGIDREPEG